jgi:hypothetical protein
MRNDAKRCETMRNDAKRCETMRSDAMRCDAMRSEAMRSDAMRCDAIYDAETRLSIGGYRSLYSSFSFVKEKEKEGMNSLALNYMTLYFDIYYLASVVKLNKYCTYNGKHLLKNLFNI